MTTYVYRDGRLLLKSTVQPLKVAKSANLSVPNISRFESYASPVDDSTISSHRERDLDLFRSNSYDERDVGPTHPIAKAKAERKKANNAARSEGSDPSIWRS
jgi:hypothetical protein